MLLLAVPGCDSSTGRTGDAGLLDRRMGEAGRPEARIVDQEKPPACMPSSETYDTLAPSNPYDGDPSKQPDMNLLMRSWRAASETKALVDVSGPTDTKPGPQLYSLFSDDRVPTFSNVYQLQDWDWTNSAPGAYITDPPVTLAGMATTPDEVIRAPFSGYDLGGGHTAMVIYLGKDTVTLKYTTDDDVVKGYTVHIEGICVDLGLSVAYDQCNFGQRKTLPVLKSRQQIGRALGSEIRVAVRDTGSLMDPRSRKDWWQGK